MADEAAKPNSFVREFKVYEARKPELLKALGQYVAVYGDTLLGPYSTYAIAYSEGLKTFGDVPIMIKQILEEEPINYTQTISVSSNPHSLSCHISI